MPERLKSKPCDFIYLTAALALLVFGLVMVFSSSSYAALKTFDDSWYFFKHECVYASIGFIAMIACIFLPIKALYNMTPIIALVSLGLLLVMFTPLASEYNGATRWIEAGPVTIMPGEIAKFTVILVVARYLGSKPERIRSLFKGVLPVLAYCGLNFYLIYKQPSLSTAVTLVGIVLGLMFLAGMNLIYAGSALGAVSVGLFYMIISDESGYHFKRMTSFLNPFDLPRDDGYQVVQSLLSMGAGGVFGVGLGNSIQKALYLPEGHNDFILSIIAEELGFVGCLALLLVYLVLIYRGVMIAIKAPDRFSMLTASGITLMFAIQVILNVLVVTSWMPPTGVVLPLVSYGGNALILCLTQVGIMLNISRRINAEPVAARDKDDAETRTVIEKRKVDTVKKVEDKGKERTRVRPSAAHRRNDGNKRKVEINKSNIIELKDKEYVPRKRRNASKKGVKTTSRSTARRNTYRQSSARGKR